MATSNRRNKTGASGIQALDDGSLGRAQTMADAARRLATAHRVLDPAMTAWWASGTGEIQLIEVTPSVAETDELVSFRFTGNEDFEIAYDLRLVIVNDAEWARVQSGKLQLPKGWQAVNKFQQIQI